MTKKKKKNQNIFMKCDNTRDKEPKSTGKKLTGKGLGIRTATDLSTLEPRNGTL